MIRLFNDQKYSTLKQKNLFHYSPRLNYMIALFDVIELYKFIKGIIYFNPHVSINDVVNYCDHYKKYFFNGKIQNKFKKHITEEELITYVNQCFETNQEYNKFLSECNIQYENHLNNTEWYQYHEKGFYSFPLMKEKLIRKRITKPDMDYILCGLLYMNPTIGPDEIIQIFSLLESTYNEKDLHKKIKEVYLNHDPEFETDLCYYTIPKKNLVPLHRFGKDYHPDDLMYNAGFKIMEYFKGPITSFDVTITAYEVPDNLNITKKDLSNMIFSIDELLKNNIIISDYRFIPISLDISGSSQNVLIIFQEMTIADKIQLI